MAKPEQYGFDLDVLVGSVLSLGLQLGAHDRFVAAVSAEPDYSEEVGGAGAEEEGVGGGARGGRRVGGAEAWCICLQVERWRRGWLGK